MKMEICRTGNFIGKGIIQKDGKCGPIGDVRFKYEVTIHGYDNHLIPSYDFIIDALEIDKYFSDTYTKKKSKHAISCENMSLAAVSYFHDLFKNNPTKDTLAKYPNPSIYAIECKIWGAKDRYVSSLWEQ